MKRCSERGYNRSAGRFIWGIPINMRLAIQASRDYEVIQRVGNEK
jgi:hypothetical protein